MSVDEAIKLRGYQSRADIVIIQVVFELKLERRSLTRFRFFIVFFSFAGQNAADTRDETRFRNINRRSFSVDPTKNRRFPRLSITLNLLHLFRPDSEFFPEDLRISNEQENSEQTSLEIITV
jgi:hypothetical protein